MSRRKIPHFFEGMGEVSLHAGQSVFTIGQKPENYLVVVDGCVKVFVCSSEGREAILYRVKAGEMCTLTTVSLLGHTDYQAEAITEVDTTAKLIPANQFHQLLNESEPFRRFVFNALSGRLARIMERFEELALESVHKRLATFLLRKSTGDGLIKLTHQTLATEIGTAREVVSRHLKIMEQAGLLETHRGSIRVLRPGALAETS